MSALTSLLVRDEIVPVRTIEEALLRQVISGGDVETVLLEMDAVPENVLAAYRAVSYELAPATRAEVVDARTDVVELVPREVAIEHRVVPLRVEGRSLHLAVHEPLTRAQVERLGLSLPYDLVLQIVCEVRIAAGLAQHYAAELTPRMARLIDQVTARDGGPVVAVERLDPRLLSGHGAEVPNKRAAAVTPFAGSSRPEFLVEPTGSGAIAAGGGSTTAARGRRAPSRSDASRPPMSGLRRLRGPLTLDAAQDLLNEATSRDHILEVLFAFARQFFDYTALFVVHDEVADARRAEGPGASTEEVIALGIPLDRPSGFAEALRTRAPRVRRLDETEVDRDICRGLSRPDSPPALVMPIAIRQRVVLVVYGDRDGETFDLDTTMDLVRFAPRVAEAFQGLILRRKSVGYASSTASAEDTDARTRLRATMRRVGSSLDRASESGPGPTDEPAWRPVSGPTAGSDLVPERPLAAKQGRSPSEPAVSAVPAPVEPAPGASRPPASSGPGSTADTLPPPPAGASPDPPASPRPLGGSPARVLGIPRAAPPPPSSGELDLGRVFSGADGGDDPELTFGDEPELTFGDDPELTFGDDPELTFGDDSELMFGDEPSVDDPPERGADRVGALDDPPYPRTAASRKIRDDPPPPQVRRPVRVDGTYSKRTIRVERIPSEVPIAAPPGGELEGSSSPAGDNDGAEASLEDLLTASTPEACDLVIARFVALGEAALPILAGAFPGPVSWTTARGRVPRAADLSPVSRAFSAIGQPAAPYVATLLGASDTITRFCAIIVAREMVCAQLMEAVFDRVYDSDRAVRGLAVALLPRFEGFEGFEEARDSWRRLSLGGGDPTRCAYAVDALTSLRDVEMIPRWIDSMDDDDLEEHVQAALVTLTGTDLGASRGPWTDWWTKNRRAHRIEWLIEGLGSDRERVRHDVARELEGITQEHYGFVASAPAADRDRVAERYREWWRAEGRRRFD